LRRVSQPVHLREPYVPEGPSAQKS
jgi:hypothetical protein